ncbi:4'-phosphopantetheinyl transferase family protein [Ruegeria atlantica]|uniref:4'-phosphopantetheinyl transferase family protein n=1 Tax=Ruegeria atlantica TaxID=81569 RepID=UPI0024940FE7|nr:4'-phosphopantetheinyl transferase superfamily protein [Ruegeria atlantica]
MPKVDIWQWSLDIPEAQSLRLSRCLSVDEIQRAKRFVKPRDKYMYIAGRARLREILAQYLGVTAESVAIDYGPNGKPMLNAGPHFNLSHSDGRAILAVCENTGIGIDIEQIRPIEDAVAKHHFSPAEYAELSALPRTNWLQGFFQCWTRKEAVLKMLGHGLFMPLDSFDVTLAPGGSVQLTRIEGDNPARWSLVHLAPAAGWVGALALRDAVEPIELVWRATDLDPINTPQKVTHTNDQT